MATLLYAENGVVSLELAEAELSKLKTLIESNWGKPGLIRHAYFDCFKIAGQEFTFQNQWDDPCLISSTPEGSAMLKKLCDQLSPK